MATTAPPEQQRELARQKQLTALTTTLQQKQALSSQDNKNIPVVLAQSDGALKQAQSYRNQAAKTKDAKAKKAILDKAQKSQDLADKKAAELVGLRQDLETQLTAVVDLQKQIQGLGRHDHGTKIAAQNDNGGGGAKSAKSSSKHDRRVASRKQKSGM